MTLHRDSAVTLLAHARAADPAFFPAQHEYIRLRLGEFRGEFTAIRQAYAVPDTRGGTVTACLALATAAIPPSVTHFAPAEAGPLAQLIRLERQGDASGCAATYLAELIRYGNNVLSNPIALSYARRATRLAPEIVANWRALSEGLALAGRPRDALAAVEEGLRHRHDAIGRIELYGILRQAREALGDTAGAARLSYAVRAAAARDPRRVIGSHLGIFGAGEDRRLLQEAGDWGGRLGRYWSEGRERLDHGDPVGAMPLLDSAVALADSVALPWNRLVSLMHRGRAESKLGRMVAGERDLRLAIAAGADAPDMYYLAEAWHNLAHVYEGQGRWTEAAGAADQFVALTQPMRFDDHRVVSLYDAGTIRWEAGWHAAAQADFAAMVRAVDDQRAHGYSHNDHWAGEYFERQGDWARALAYYHAAARDDRAGGEPQTLAGLVRVYEALGQDDSAELAATAHDSALARWTPLERPLLPEFLARRGRAADGVAVARQWAARQLATGNVQGAALALLQVGDLALHAGDPEDALRAATQADSLASGIHFVEQRVQAVMLAGKALITLGRSEAGLTRLQDAAALAVAHPTAASTFVTQLALGDALAATGRPAEALAAYDRAARTVERVTAQLDLDLDRAGYRARHLAPFDGALAVLFARPGSHARADPVLRWSERRKAAGIALASGGAPPSRGVRSATVPLAALQARLPPRSALVDYIVTDSAVAAVVVTRRRATMVRLPTPADSLGPLIDRLRRPLVASYAGHVDLARAPFDLRVAHRLYEGLVQPLVPRLDGIVRLTVIPDGPLHAVPFAALVTDPPPADRTGDYGRARFLIDTYEIAYLPSARALAGGSSQSATVPHGARVLAVARDAPGAREELAAIRVAWPPEDVTALSDTAATETSVREGVHRYAVLHVAAHAAADDRDPLASHLRLGADGDNDGYYHLAEIAADRGQPALVVLSACETLTGRLYRGEGPMGLARAFLVGGAHEVVATQWPIGPTSAGLMGGFYRQLAAGAAPRAALRWAQLALRHDPGTAHPFYWAGFELIARN